MKASLLSGLIVCAAAGWLAARDGDRTWTFDGTEPGKLPDSFRSAAGDWSIAVDGENRVLAQTASNPNPVFNIVLIENTKFGDCELSVRLRSIDGRNDQGGGLVWRAKDAKNYYIARYNPLEANLRVYKVVDGKRTMLKGTETDEKVGWTTLRVRMKGAKIEVEWDGKVRLQADDATFSEPGMIGLWTKADAQSWFDDLKAVEIAEKRHP